jgi:Ser/Thr protein kinase RdoA (MazF antagonist)
MGGDEGGDELPMLTDLVIRYYGTQAVSLQPLDSESGKRMYRVERSREQPWVLRAYPPESEDNIQALVTVLAFLEQHEYPAERLVRAEDGSFIVTHDGWRLLVTTFVEGSTVDYAPPTLRLLGATLGRLHALRSITTTPAALPLAQMRPVNEISWALSQITGVKAQVPKHLYARYDTLVAALHSIRLGEELPRVVIHNDCHPGNAVRTTAEQVVLIDWEGAGLGPAVLDVGFLLSSCETESPWTPPLPPDPARVAAVVDGYYQYHTLTPAELEYLPDAIRFRAIVYGACSFAASIAMDGKEDEDLWWWRYNAADEITERARKEFESSRGYLCSRP